jgi:hypothetical protein
MSTTPKAQQCSDVRTISVISHTPKILLHLIKKRITPMIQKLLAESLIGFRKGHAIFQLRTIADNGIRVDKKTYTCLLITRKLLTGLSMKS